MYACFGVQMGVGMKTGKLFKRDFTMIVIGQIISLFGNATLRFALPLYLLKETGSAALFGLVTACSFLPMIILSLLGGVMADRVNKRNIMVALDFCTALLIICFSLALGHVPLVPLFIIVLMVLYGIQGAYQPSVQASIPAVVDQENLIGANAVINQVNSLSSLLGPMIGGVLYGAFGIEVILGLSILCFFVSAVMEIFIHIPFQKREAEGNVFQIVGRDLRESSRFVRSEQPVFLRGAVIVACFNMFLSAALVVGLPVLLVEYLGVSDSLFGFSQGLMGLGGILGGVLAGVLGKRLRINRVGGTLALCVLCVVPIGIVLLLPIPVMACYWIITIMSLLCVAASTVFTVQMLSFVQGKTPPELVGKVIAAILAISTCAHPVGQAFYGILFERFAATPGVVMLGAALGGAIITVVSAKTFRAIE